MMRTNNKPIQTRKNRRPIHTRICVACRQRKPQKSLLRLTVNAQNGRVMLNSGEVPLIGRSCYLCPSKNCIEGGVSGTRLKVALVGQKHKSSSPKRNVQWPLEPQLILLMFSKCTEPEKTCQNTEGKEDLDERKGSSL